MPSPKPSLKEYVQADTPLKVLFIPVPDFSLTSLSLAIEALRTANREALMPLFSWEIATLDGRPSLSSCGIPVSPTLSLPDIDYAPVIIINASWTPEQAYDGDFFAWLHRQDRKGSMIGTIESGCFILAKANLLKGQQIALHDEAIGEFSEAFGSGHISGQLMTISSNRMSCSGGITTLDMLLAFIERLHGPALSDSVADIFNYSRPSQDRLDLSSRKKYAHAKTDRTLARCIELMQSSIESPLSLKEISAAVGTPDWKIRRLFQRNLGQTPHLYYLNMRLKHAWALLEHGRIPIQEIALACGFSDAPGFSNAFRKRYKMTPSHCRARTIPGFRYGA